MHETPQPRRDDEWLCIHTEEGRGFGIHCVCFQGYEDGGRWRVYVDRNGVAYTQWKSFAERSF